LKVSIQPINDFYLKFYLLFKKNCIFEKKMKIEDRIIPTYFKFADMEIRIIEVSKGRFISQYKKKGFWCNKWINLVTYSGSKDAYASASITDAVKSAIYLFSENMRYPIRIHF